MNLVQRLIGLLIAVAVAAALVFALDRGSDAPRPAVLSVERLLAAGRIDEAQRELAGEASRLDPATQDYLEGLILVARRRDADAVAPLERSVAARPDDWRVVATLVSAAANSGAHARAAEVVDAYLTRHAADERALAMAAQLRLDVRSPKHDAEKAMDLLDRLAALERRVAGPGDPTAVRDEDVSRMRVRAQLALGRAMGALNDARALVTKWPSDAEGWFLVGEAARASSRAADEAIVAYRRAFELAPMNRRYGEQYVMALLELSGDAREIMRVIEALRAREPDDTALLVLQARALVRLDRIDEANDLYAALLQRDLPRERRLEVLRNRGVLLYDWKQGGREGVYLDDAHRLLDEYVRLGGDVDDTLRPTWNDLVARARKVQHPPK
jgi:tetratricopeptide (TPR) repeat protein